MRCVNLQGTAYMYSKKINKFILSFIIQYNRVWIKIC